MAKNKEKYFKQQNFLYKNVDLNMISVFKGILSILMGLSFLI